MPHYRAHILDEHGHLIGAADFDCADDVKAEERARQLDGHRVEFWRQACGIAPGICAPSRVQLTGIRNFASRLYRSNCLDIPTYVPVLKFDEPIELVKGKPLRTLRDAGEYVTAQPKADQSRLYWQTARAGARTGCSIEKIRCPG
jgi:hypothetical protein